MAFIKSKKLYAILMNNDRGKQIVRDAPKLSDEQLQNKIDEFMKSSGTSESDVSEQPQKPRTLYHQTSVKSLSEFDESKRKAGLSDIGTPKGIFLKETAEDIGLSGKNQLKLLADIKNPLEIDNRDDLASVFESITGKNVKSIEKEIDDFYESKNQELEDEIDSVYNEYFYEKDPVKKEKLKSKMDDLQKQQNDHIEKWNDVGKEASQVVQEEMTKALKELGYDGVIMNNDEGSLGRKVKTYIVFDKNQLIELDNDSLPEKEKQRLQNL